MSRIAVLRSQRKTSMWEYENTLARLYNYSMRKTVAVPKRRRKWLCQEIDTVMNRVYFDVMGINTNYIPNRDEKFAYTADVAMRSAEALMSLQKPLIVLWNVQKYTGNSMIEWASLIQRECLLLRGVAKQKGTERLMILDWRSINAANFLKNMSELHRYTHGKVANAYMAFDNTHGKLLIEEVDNAFYHLILANQKIPETQNEYDARRKNISASISCLKRMNRSLVFYFNLMKYSERVMNEWSDLLTQELKMLYALQQSDKARFGSLE